MSWPDVVNGSFECLGALFILPSIFRLYRDKLVRGVHWTQVAFFSAWGYWNLFFYPHLGQWMSFVGGVALVLANTFWLGQIVWYILAERRVARALPGGSMDQGA